MMVERIGKAAMLEQLAEECAELGKAALKMARIIRCENPTPMTQEEAQKALTEEYTDVRTCAEELHLAYDRYIEEKKQDRFKERWTDFACCPNCGHDTGGKFKRCQACGYQAEE